MTQKIKFLFIPFILTLLSLIAGFSFLHWILFIKFEVFQAKTIITNFIIPTVLAGFMAWLFFRRRLKILSLQENRRDAFSFILWIILSIPLIISQEYIVTATGKLTQLNSINDINRLEPTKYYNLKNCYLDKNAIRINYSSAVTGKSNQNFEMNIYVAIGIFDRKSDVNHLEPVAWLGLEYQKTVSNRLNATKKEKEYQEFAKQSQIDFENKDVYDFVYLDRLRYSDKRERFIEAIKSSPIYTPNEIILVAVNEPFEARNGKKLEWILGSSLIGSAIWLLLILIPKVDQRTFNRLNAKKHSRFTFNDLRQIPTFFIPQEGYFVTPVLIFLNVGVYLSMTLAGLGFISFQPQDLLQWGANFGPLTNNREWWRLLTSTFLHGGILHLVANMYGLLFVGIQVEKKIGSANFLSIYLLTGLIAGIVSFNFNLFQVSVGASGAIFGIYGLLLVETIRENPDNKVAILANFFSYLVTTLLVGIQLNFDNAAHIGGVISGILVGISYRKLKFRLVHSLAIALVFVLSLISPSYQSDYLKASQFFSSNEGRIVKILKGRMSDKVLYDSLVKIKGLPEETIAEFRAMSYLPRKLRGDTAVISEYMTLRSYQIDFYIKGISKESYIYMDSIGVADFKIASLPALEYKLEFEPEAMPDSDIPEEFEELDIVRQLYDSDWFEVASGEFEYYRIGQKDSLGDWHGRVEDYYKNGAIQMKGQYERGLKNGIFIYYNPDSTYSSAGRYIADDRIGKWETYHKNGRLYVETRHGNGFSRIENLWDSTGVQTVIDRNGKEIYRYPNGKISFERTIVDGLNQGFVESYYENGDLRYKEYYEKGKLIKGVSFVDRAENTYDMSVNIAYPAGGFESFYEYIDKANMLQSDSIDGVVVIRFDVHPSGEILDVRFLKRYHEKYNQYAKELLLNGPTWIPARSHGLSEITSSAEVTIKF